MMEPTAQFYLNKKYSREICQMVKTTFRAHIMANSCENSNKINPIALVQYYTDIGYFLNHIPGFRDL